ncbi:hypothetical protein C1645_745154 [Glomus cerebriforme]|uniref:Uncharacterized protein n=1 Tax=Glomus cerebriforme TaxID=658196 RepID=A0A397SDV3_9GLOM|nr:hypothetical protein C1645_745154 [Glomus cerebriforme]
MKKDDQQHKKTFEEFRQPKYINISSINSSKQSVRSQQSSSNVEIFSKTTGRVPLKKPTTFQLILEDLNEITPITSILPLIQYEQNLDPVKKIKILFRQLRRAKSLNNKLDQLYYAYRIGEIVETQTETPIQRTLCISVLTEYYKKVVVRVYYLFEQLGPEQIYRTSHITLARVFQLKSTDFSRLVQVTDDIVRAQSNFEINT